MHLQRLSRSSQISIVTLLVIVFALIASCDTARAALLRRIALDGTESVTAPTAELADTTDLIYLIHNVPTPMLELFPTARKPARGTIIVCPGGGYRSLAITHEGYNVAKKLNEFGFDAAVLLYHLRADNETKQWAQAVALTNAETALALLQNRGGEFGLSTQKIGLIGFSAGGHLAARLTHVTATGKPPDFLAMFYPGAGGAVVGVDDFAPGKTPVFLYVAADDLMHVTNCVAYATACKQENVPCVFYTAARGGHGFGLRTSQPAEVKDWPDKFKVFLDDLK